MVDPKLVDALKALVVAPGSLPDADAIALIASVVWQMIPLDNGGPVSTDTRLVTQVGSDPVAIEAVAAEAVSFG